MVPLRYAAKFDPFLSLDCARVEGAGKGKEGIKFCHLATMHPSLVHSCGCFSSVWVHMWPFRCELFGNTLSQPGDSQGWAFQLLALVPALAFLTYVIMFTWHQTKRVEVGREWKSERSVLKVHKVGRLRLNYS